MNPSQIAEALKTVPDDYLNAAVQGQVSTTPGYLALSELKRRQSIRGQAMQPPMTTVAQDQMPAAMRPQPQQGMPQGISAMGAAQQNPQAMGIGSVRKFAAGGAVTRGYGGAFDEEGNYVPIDERPYTEPPIFGFARDAWNALKKYNADALNREQMARAMSPYVPRRAAKSGDVPIYNAGTEVADDGGPGAPPKVVPAVANERVRPTSMRASVSNGISSVAPQQAAQPPDTSSKVQAEDFQIADPNTVMSRVPTSKILEQIAKDAAVDKGEFKRRRDEAKTDALLRFAERMTSQGGGFGGNFAAAAAEGVRAQRQGEKEVRAEERQAQQDLRNVQLAQAQEEMGRFRTAQDMSKQDYDVQVSNFARKYGVSKDEADRLFKEKELAQRKAIADAQNATHLAAAKISAAARAGAGDKTDIEVMKQLARSKAMSLQQAEADVKNPMRLFDLQRKYGTKDASVIKNKLADEYFKSSVSQNPMLAALSDEIFPSTMAPASAVPGVAVTSRPSNSGVMPR